MTLETNEGPQGRTGDTVPRTGQYVAVCCCREKRGLNQGELFPACPAHGKSTVWGEAAPGAAVCAAAGGPSGQR